MRTKIEREALKARSGDGGQMKEIKKSVNMLVHLVVFPEKQFISIKTPGRATSSIGGIFDALRAALMLFIYLFIYAENGS